MADSSPYTKPHFPAPRIQPKTTNQGKSCTGFLLKALILALFLVVLPLFPSQAPDFVSQTILNKFWELLHLLFIGIAVTYGLFSRRNSELDTHVEIETHPSGVDDANAPSYVSKVFPASTIFDDGFGYSVGWDGNGTNVVQAWNAEYYHSEPVVVVAQPNYNSGECGEAVDYKPLGLPIRSLRSVARDVDSSKFANESDSSSGSKGSSRSLGESRDREFGDTGPSNLEKKLNDAGGGGSPSPIPWRSRNRRSEREKVHGNVSRPSQYRPLSVGETKFEALGSGSLQSTTPFSSHINIRMATKGKNGMMDSKGKSAADLHPSHFRPISVDETQQESLSSRSFQSMGSFSSQSSLCSSPDSASPENMNLLKEDIGEKKSSHGSSSTSPSPLGRRNEEASLQAFQARRHNGSSLQDDIKSSLNDDLRGLNGLGGEDPSGNKESGKHASQSDSEKPASLVKTPSRGKSVRTRRSNGLISGTMRIGEISSKETDEQVEKNLNNVESVLRKDRIKSGEPDLPLKGFSKKTLDSYFPKPEIKFSNHRMRHKSEPSKNLSKQDSDTELENTLVSSKENGVPEYVNDSDLDSEVDKKASEFIAKFKAQIRLQKMGSIERSKEQKTTLNKIR
uniref:Uncharacterized protein n=1 Tax=Cajanus cajan TaxID=3821 RepID=A0A151TQB1_CAJCA|nr:hypothetical protein KK1_008454 [Cajanus cajan]